MIRVLMGNQSRTSRTVGRPISSGLGPSLLLAVAVMVLASGGVSSVRVIGSAGVGLAMTVISDRAIAMSMPREQDGPEFARPVEFSKFTVDRAPVTGDALTCWMVRAGCLDLPPPAYVLS